MLKHKVKHFLNKNFKINGIFSDHEFDQTDFGRIYFNLPEITEHPVTKEQLATVLKHYHTIGRPVTIRNTGHSINGQTLTSGVQVNVGSINHVHFDAMKMEVVAGCGASWDKVLRSVGLPKFCLPIFPNNPNQEIHIGGTVSVGGISSYSKTRGGLWHHVLEITLVTMSGKIIRCSRNENPEYFYYSLGGFGRIGVIAEVKMKVVSSLKEVILLASYSHNSEKYFENLNSVAEDDGIMGAMSGVHLSSIKKITATNHFIFSVFEKDRLTARKAGEYFNTRHPNDISMFAYGEKSEHSNFKLSLEPKKFSKEKLVYWYPEPLGEDQLNCSHVWCEGAIPKAMFESFIQKVTALIYRYGMDKYLVKESFFRGKVNAAFVASYIIKNINPGKYPVCLYFPSDDYFYGVVVDINCPQTQVKKALEFSKKFTDILYEMGGKHYLCCLHSMSKSQVIEHYGRATIHKWQEIKDELDPKHLLNIGVIEHLDDM
jgi:FAD/FMN-containing dehydrogenase